MFFGALRAFAHAVHPADGDRSLPKREWLRGGLSCLLVWLVRLVRLVGLVGLVGLVRGRGERSLRRSADFLGRLRSFRRCGHGESRDVCGRSKGGLMGTLLESVVGSVR